MLKRRTRTFRAGSARSALPLSWRLRSALVVALVALALAAMAAGACLEYGSLREALQLHLPFDRDWRDIMGTSHPVAPNNLSFSVGKVGSGGGMFSQINRQFVSLGVLPTVNLDSPRGFSFSMWLVNAGFDMTKGSYGEPSVFGNLDRRRDFLGGVTLSMSPASTGQWALQDDNRRVRVTGRSYDFSTWQHLVITNDRRGTSRMYIAGQKVAEEDITSITTLNTDLPYVLGSDASFGENYWNWFDGGIDDFMFFRRVLTQDEISALYLSAFGGVSIHEGVVTGCGSLSGVCSGLPRTSGTYIVTCATPAKCAFPADASMSLDANGTLWFGANNASVCGAAARLGYAPVNKTRVAVSYDASSATFSVRPFCGDRITAGAEECDDGNWIEGDGCDRACRVERGFACVNGTCFELCGDGVVTLSEQCDDGNTASGDGCSSTCAFEGGFHCGARFANGTSHCTPNSCGDGLRADAEACDDGNGDDGDGCSSACAVEPCYVCERPTPSSADNCHPHLYVAANGTDGSVSCTAQSPCRSLEAAVAVAAGFRSGAFTVHVGPGDYTVQSTVLISAAGAVSILGSGRVRVSCASMGPALYVNGSSSLTVVGLTFEGCVSDMAAVVVRGTFANFTLCNFASNRAVTSVTGLAAGGLLATSLARMSLTECNFRNNSASVPLGYRVAGALVADEVASVKMSGCSFEHNSADGAPWVAGGAMFSGAAWSSVSIESSTVGSNAAIGTMYAAGGTAILSRSGYKYARDLRVSVQGTDFRGNKALLVKGPETAQWLEMSASVGGLLVGMEHTVVDNYKLRVSGGTFDGNKARATDASLATMGGLGVTMWTFGGATNNSVEVEGVAFTGNVGELNKPRNGLVGGGIAILYLTGAVIRNSASVTSCRFDRNNATGVGASGSMASGSFGLMVLATTLMQWDAMGNSVLAADNVHANETVTLDGTNAYGKGTDFNVAAAAYGVFVQSTSGDVVKVISFNTVSLLRVVVSSCWAFLSGATQNVGSGGVSVFYLGGASDNVHSVVESHFVGGTLTMPTTGSGCVGSGAISLFCRGDSARNNVRFLKGTCANALVTTQSGGSSGCIALWYEGSVEQQTTAVEHSVFYDNASPTGAGAVFVSALTGSGANVSVAGSVFDRNRGGGLSGALYFRVAGSSSISLSQSVFTGNAGIFGGALDAYIAAQGILVASDCAFSNNDGGIIGGAWMLEEETRAAAINCTFVENDAAIAGAVFVGRAGHLSTASCHLARNRAYSGSEVFSAGGDLVLNATDVNIVTEVAGINVVNPGYQPLSLLQGSQVTCPKGLQLVSASSGSLESLSCKECLTGTYSILNGSSSHGVSCLDCPFGAFCDRGAQIRPRPFYWLNFDTDSVEPVKCPYGYCCDSVAACAESPCKKNRTGIVCSECPEGKSLTLFFGYCVDDDQCKYVTLYFVLAVVIAVAIVTILFFVSTARSGTFKTITQFAYISQLVVNVGTQRQSDVIYTLNSIIASTFGFDSDSGTDLCLFKGMSSAGRVGFDMVPPGILLVVACLGTVTQVLYKKHRHERKLRNGDIKSGEVFAPSEKVNFGPLFTVILFVYAPLLKTTFQLLQCVDIGGDLRLLRDATVQCYDNWWQIFAWCCVPVFLSVPVLLFYLSRRDPDNVSKMFKTLVAIVSDAYITKYMWWESVLFLRRFVLTIAAVFIVDAFTRSFVLWLLILGCFLSNIVCRPFARTRDHYAESFLLFSLVIVATIELRSSFVISEGINESRLDPFQTRFGEALAWMEAAILLAGVVYIGVTLVRWCYIFLVTDPIYRKMFRKYSLRVDVEGKVFRDGFKTRRFSVKLFKGKKASEIDSYMRSENRHPTAGETIDADRTVADLPSATLGEAPIEQIDVSHIARWAALRSQASDFELSGICSFAVIFGTWFVGVIPYTILDEFNISFVRKYKISRTPTPPALKWLAARMVAINFAFLILPLSLASYRVVGMLLDDGPLPSLATALLHIAIFFVTDDVWFYAYHRFLHTHPSLYKRFHKPHHVFTAPFALTSHATHPVEMSLQMLGSVPGLLLLRPHVTTFWAWLFVRQLTGIEDHIGYAFPWSLSRAVPPIGGSEFHFDHHSKNTGNYASLFPVLDDLFGTRIAASSKPGKRQE